MESSLFQSYKTVAAKLNNFEFDARMLVDTAIRLTVELYK